MKKYVVTLNQNGGEYKGYASINCFQSVEKIGIKTILIDDNIQIKFDDEVYDIIRDVQCGKGSNKNE